MLQQAFLNALSIGYETGKKEKFFLRPFWTMLLDIDLDSFDSLNGFDSLSQE